LHSVAGGRVLGREGNTVERLQGRRARADKAAGRTVKGTKSSKATGNRQIKFDHRGTGLLGN